MADSLKFLERGRSCLRNVDVYYCLDGNVHIVIYDDSQIQEVDTSDVVFEDGEAAQQREGTTVIETPILERKQ